MFLIALDAGHYLGTPGKRVRKSLDKNQTREWVLNDRVARYVEQAASAYENAQVFRVDDATGKQAVDLKTRCARANQKGADFYLSVHHNAGVNGGAGGGMVAYSYKKSQKNSPAYRDEIYDTCLAQGGLRGNRANPKTTANFYVLKNTKMPAVLMEYGFMDSKTDAPVILTDSYARAVGYATMQAIARVAGLDNKQEVTQVDVKVLKKGAKGEAVKAMQLLLMGNGFSCGEKGADGSFGGATDKALRAYQKHRGLAVDGSCGGKTWAALLGV